MAQTTDSNQTKDQGSAPTGATPAENPELSLEQLDKMILSEDPKFAEELQSVKEMHVDASIDLDVVELDESFSQEKENPWRAAIGIRKIIVVILPFLPALWDWQYRIKSALRLARSRWKSFLRELGPNLLRGLKNAAVWLGHALKTQVTNFQGLNWKMKVLALGLIAACGFTGFFIYRSVTHGVLPEDQQLLMASFEEWSANTYKFDPETEMDSFYDSPRTIQNIMSLPKMVVNLRPSANSGENPMAAMEFFLEGMSPEAIVEVKDRESEIRDLFQRTMEDMSFDELDSGEGKQQLTERLRQNINGVLTKGKIRRVFIKEAVIKP